MVDFVKTVIIVVNVPYEPFFLLLPIMVYLGRLQMKGVPFFN